MAGELPLMAVRSQIASALDIMVHLGRLRDKSRKVLEIVEVGDFENGEIQLNPLFRFEEESDEDQKKRDEGRRREKVKGSLVKVGSLRSVEKLRQAGYPV